MDLEDKILGNKLENYCSSSEDEAGYEDASDGESAEANSGAGGGAGLDASATAPGKTYFTPVEKWNGQSANTGPKGVIKDWQRFKQLETEKNEEKERERIQLAKRLAITTQTAAEDAERKEQEALEAEFAELMNEDTLLEFQRRRMVEMMERCGQQQIFGKVLNLNNGDDFLNAVDQESKLTTVVIHIYETHLAACKTLNKCLSTLADEYRQVKFCKILGSVAGLSKGFKVGGMPAVLVYKAGALIGNFVRIADDLGGDVFYATDVEGFLIENGMLPDKTHAPSIISGGTAAQADSSDDD